MTTKEIDFKLTMALTEYDRKQSQKKFYNPFALNLYLERISKIVKDIEKGTSPRKAILKGFNDRLLDVALKAIGEPKATIEEVRSQSLTY